MSKDPKSTYYDAGGIETLDIIRAKLTPEQYKGFLLGNAIKYSCRGNFKGDPKRDAEKSAFYAEQFLCAFENPTFQECPQHITEEIKKDRQILRVHGGIPPRHASCIETLVMAHGDDFGLCELAAQLRRIYKKPEAPGNER